MATRCPAWNWMPLTLARHSEAFPHSFPTPGETVSFETFHLRTTQRNKTLTKRNSCTSQPLKGKTWKQRRRQVFGTAWPVTELQLTPFKHGVSRGRMESVTPARRSNTLLSDTLPPPQLPPLTFNHRKR
ncbi:hypothetical protein DPEC_G00205490 [Dallia pectoralis]|uniref:Uncharacterized protein n=1 Tax=Dallia pectoralis TaxID=75939 RepID=A0ACC2G4L6_DALPE|nr:hypothetical protein DPEC_G00205490 [Dallia pectoralis]